MPFTELLTESGRILWRHKFLSLLGFGYVIGGGLLGIFLQIWLTTNPFGDLDASFGDNPDQFIIDLLDSFFQPGIMIALVLLIVGYILVVWIVATVSEAGLIEGVREYRAGRSISLTSMIRAGRRYLIRLVAVDTLVFLPLFLILLFALLLTSAALIGFILTAASGTFDIEAVLAGGTVVWFIDMALIFLAVIIGLITSIFRQLAFRSAILADLKTREAVKHAWAVLRQNWLMIIVILILLYAIGRVVGLVSTFLLLPTQAYTMIRVFGSTSAGVPVDPLAFFEQPLLIDIWTLIVTVIGIVLRAIVFTFGSIFWTLCYLHWEQDETNRG